ncbi:MAG: KR domain-containing protein, partial [Planctomycetales bacterium]|nr:KR domain-containing protein [Planctomycetales bacterium]
VLHTIDQQLPPLRGVFHTAMVLEDKLLADLDRETLDRVLRPKMLGGWNLHRETLHRELETFVLFSSLSSVFGHAGQANYAAANSLLDSLAYYRRAQGLPATVLNWGHLGGAGYLAERQQLGKRLERQGVLSFTVEQATQCLEYALQTKAVQMSVLRMDWTLWRGLGITNRVSPRFAHLLRSSQEDTTGPVGEEATPRSLRNAQGEERFALLDRLLRGKAGSLLGLPPEQLPADRALLELGLDSLMAVELRNWIESQLQIHVPISALMRRDSLRQVVLGLCQAVEDTATSGSIVDIATDRAADRVSVSSDQPYSSEGPAAEDISPQQAASLLADLPHLPPEEISQLLSQMLRQQP